MQKTINQRKAKHSALNKIFIERWSPRAFKEDKLSQEQIDTLFEAAHWAPSSYNAQPWYFVYASTDEALNKLRPVMVEQNQAWANKAPLLILVFARKKLEFNGKDNTKAQFDSGSAWMSLALQAHSMGLITHAMGGFYDDKAYEVAGLSPDEFTPMCVIAVGYHGNTEDLPQPFQEKELPSERKAINEVVRSLN